MVISPETDGARRSSVGKCKRQASGLTGPMKMCPKHGAWVGILHSPMVASSPSIACLTVNNITAHTFVTEDPYWFSASSLVPFQDIRSCTLLAHSSTSTVGIHRKDCIITHTSVSCAEGCVGSVRSMYMHIVAYVLYCTLNCLCVGINWACMPNSMVLLPVICTVQLPVSVLFKLCHLYFRQYERIISVV